MSAPPAETRSPSLQEVMDLTNQAIQVDTQIIPPNKKKRACTFGEEKRMLTKAFNSPQPDKASSDKPLLQDTSVPPTKSQRLSQQEIMDLTNQLIQRENQIIASKKRKHVCTSEEEKGMLTKAFNFKLFPDKATRKDVSVIPDETQRLTQHVIMDLSNKLVQSETQIEMLTRQLGDATALNHLLRCQLQNKASQLARLELTNTRTIPGSSQMDEISRYYHNK